MKATTTLILGILLLTGCRKPNEPTQYTVEYYAYSTNVPYTVRYADQDYNWQEFTVTTNNHTSSITDQTKPGQIFLFTAKNNVQTPNDSIYTRITIGSESDADWFRCNLCWLEVSSTLQSKK